MFINPVDLLYKDALMMITIIINLCNQFSLPRTRLNLLHFPLVLILYRNPAGTDRTWPQKLQTWIPFSICCILLKALAALESGLEKNCEDVCCVHKITRAFTVCVHSDFSLQIISSWKIPTISIGLEVNAVYHTSTITPVFELAKRICVLRCYRKCGIGIVISLN